AVAVVDPTIWATSHTHSSSSCVSAYAIFILVSSASTLNNWADLWMAGAWINGCSRFTFSSSKQKISQVGAFSAIPLTSIIKCMFEYYHDSGEIIKRSFDYSRKQACLPSDAARSR